jgi:hypothetical protein
MLKTMACASIIVAALAATPAAADTRVRGHSRSDGTYVQPHDRSTPDRSYNNNWSVSPNVNPYNGHPGTRAPTLNDRAPSNLYGNPSRSRW